MLIDNYDSDFEKSSWLRRPLSLLVKLENRGADSSRGQYKLVIEFLIGVQVEDWIEEVNCGFSEISLDDFNMTMVTIMKISF
jgi:hypothetical protein